MENYKVIANENILKSFLKDLGLFDLKVTESWTVQTAFRVKRFSDHERELLAKKSREVFMIKALKTDRKGSVNVEEIINRLYELEVPIRSCTYNIDTPEEISFPQSALVTYIAVNKTDEIEVAANHMKDVIQIFTNSLQCGAVQHDYFRGLVARTNKDYRSERASCTINRFTDFDIDLKDATGYEVWRMEAEAIRSKLKGFFGTGTLIVICTGGFHFLVPKTYIRENPKDICKKLKDAFKDLSSMRIKDIEYKGPQSYTPLPGTYQYGTNEDCIVNYEKLR